MDYAWVAAGSQARSEQTAKSDQDNCMILDDAYDEAAHGAYFKDLATFVCDGLDACGYVHCPGEMMAMTDKWRQPRRVWAEYFRKWVDTPEPMALMLTCVFFDVRTVVGPAGLLEGLRSEVLRRTKDSRLFLALHGGQCADAPAAARPLRRPVRRPVDDPQRRTQGHHRPQAQRHRAGDRPRPRLRTGRRPRRGEHA